MYQAKSGFYTVFVRHYRIKSRAACSGGACAGEAGKPDSVSSGKAGEG